MMLQFCLVVSLTIAAPFPEQTGLSGCPNPNGSLGLSSLEGSASPGFSSTGGLSITTSRPSNRATISPPHAHNMSNAPQSEVVTTPLLLPSNPFLRDLLGDLPTAPRKVGSGDIVNSEQHLNGSGRLQQPVDPSLPARREEVNSEYENMQTERPRNAGAEETEYVWVLNSLQLRCLVECWIMWATINV